MRLFAVLFFVGCGSEGMAPCPSGQTRCDEQCFDLMTSAEHCGSCAATDAGIGGPCAEGLACQDGVCVPDCPVNARLCDDGTGALTCQDLTAAHDHCGTCETACAADQICFAGVCETGTCSDLGRQNCGGACVDVNGNPMHCGRCNNPCDSDLLCDEGVCQTDCAGGDMECEGHCADTQTDVENCGSCTLACDVGQECNRGACR